MQRSFAPGILCGTSRLCDSAVKCIIAPLRIEFKNARAYDKRLWCSFTNSLHLEPQTRLMKRLTFLLVLISVGSFAQQQVFTLDDSLRGSVTPERVWWDLNFYDLNVRVQPESKSLTGKVTVRYTVLQPKNVLQIDLQPPLSITKVEQKGKTLSYTKKGKNAYFITLQEPQTKDSKQSIDVYYEGVPHEATNPPWEGGVQWTRSADGSHFIATSCQGLGASAWWPCKDHMYDEPDSMAINITVPKGYTDVSNGRLRNVTEQADGTSYSWFVKNPI